VKVVKRSKVLTNFLPGACFGEIGAFARRKRSAGVIAQEDCKLLKINALLFKQLDPLLQLKMLHIVLRNIASLVISLDDELMALTDGKIQTTDASTVCPLCGHDNRTPIEICPRCGVIPAMYKSQEQSAGSDPVEHTGVLGADVTLEDHSIN
jgi:CRP-like cAMP-binding protein